MKKLIGLFITFFILIAISSFSYAYNEGTIIVDDVKLRKNANNTSTVLELIPINEKVEVIEKDGNWYKVKYNKITGYVYNESIKVEESSSNEENNKDTNEEVIIEIGKSFKVNQNTDKYILPLVNSTVTETLEKDAQVEVIQIINNWIYISSDSGTGWIKNIDTKSGATDNKSESKTEENIENNTKNENKNEENQSTNSEVSLNKTAYVSTDGINFREEPNTDSKVLKVFAKNAKITIISEVDDNWYKIDSNGQVGYIIKTYVSDKKVESTSRSSETRTSMLASNEEIKTTNSETNNEEKVKETSTASNKGQEVVDMAKKYLGYKYVYGGETPNKGFDCSGLVKYIYKQFGYTLPHSATAQSKYGTKVEKSNLQLGDIVFFSDYKTYTGIGHCGIYIGDNKFIHASTEKTGVITSSLTSGSYVKRYVTAVRLFD